MRAECWLHTKFWYKHSQMIFYGISTQQILPHILTFVSFGISTVSNELINGIRTTTSVYCWRLNGKRLPFRRFLSAFCEEIVFTFSTLVHRSTHTIHNDAKAVNHFISPKKYQIWKRKKTYKIVIWTCHLLYANLYKITYWKIKYIYINSLQQ